MSTPEETTNRMSLMIVQGEGKASTKRQVSGVRRGSRISIKSGEPLRGGDTMQPNATLVDMFLSGRTSKARLGADENVDEEVEGEVEHGEIDVDFFPDPPCIAPCHDDEGRREEKVMGVPPQSYFKNYATWKQDDPVIAMARAKAQAFIELRNEKLGIGNTSKENTIGRLTKRSATTTLRSATDLAIVEAFVNISPHSVGVREINNLAEEHRTGETIASGQCVVVDKIAKHEGIRYLRLADGRGWVLDSSHKEQAMAKMEEVETGASWYRVVCEELVDVRLAPVYDSEARTGRLLCPKEMAVVNIKARVRGQTFVHLSDGRGWMFVMLPGTSKKAKSWADAVIAECDAEITRGDKTADQLSLPPTNDIVEVGLWTCVVGHDPVLAVGTKLNGTYIEPGDVIKVDKIAYADGNTPQVSNGSARRWLRLMDGRGWVPERSLSGKDLVTLRREPMVSYPAHFQALKDIDRPSAPWMVGIA